MKKRISISLAAIHKDGYRIKSVSNSLDFKPGKMITRAEAEKLLEDSNITVRVTENK